jgi:hypothetical protein
VLSSYTRYGEDAFTCVAEKPVILASGAFAAVSPHESDDEISRTWFVAAKFTPDICSLHAVVSVHCVVPVCAPFIVNAPTKYE